jgi:hypothetical protein
MAQKEAMEQAKEVLRLMIKYRFWISIGVAALFALIAYFVGSGPVRAKADVATKKIKTAESTVKQYASPTIPTKEYQPIVQEKTGVLSKDVNTAWKTLYDRQAPLLTWPETVQERFRKWGRTWPEKTDPRLVETTIIDYIEAYPAYVSMVYKTFNPFDYETGEGVVVAPPEEALLRPAQFSIEHLPGLGKVWAAQERLWIQRTLAEVVAQVNKNAKTWDNAVIRQILTLEVGNPAAQDQRSIAHNENLEEAPSIHAPGEDTTEDATGGAGGAAGAMPAAGAAMGGGKFGGMGDMFGGMRGMMGGGGVSIQGSETVYYVKAAEDKGQYKILPVVMTVLIDQDRVQEFLVELENSPMSIQVMDFELARPTARVTKPEKGVASGGIGGMGMMMMGGMQSRMMQQMGGSAYGGMASAMQNSMMSSMGSMMAGMMAGRRGMGGMGMGAMGGGASAQPKRTGKDVRSQDRAKGRVEKQKAAEQAKGPSFFDPYFDIVQVTIYGQARFFNPPTGEPASEPSLAETATAGAPATGDASAAANEAPAQSPAANAGAEQKSTVAAAADGATPPGRRSAEVGKPAPQATEKSAPPAEEDERAAGKGAPKAAGDSAPAGENAGGASKPAAKAGGAAKPQPGGTGAKP